jgi:hypothetical protein
MPAAAHSAAAAAAASLAPPVRPGCVSDRFPSAQAGIARGTSVSELPSLWGAKSSLFSFDPHVDPPAICIAPPPSRDIYGNPLLICPLSDPGLQGLYPRWSFWHGLVPGWTVPLRHFYNKSMRCWDTSQQYRSNASKFRKVASAIDSAAGIPSFFGALDRPTVEQTRAAFAFCSQLESAYGTNSFTRYYESLSQKKRVAKVASSAGVRTVESDADDCSDSESDSRRDASGTTGTAQVCNGSGSSGNSGSKRMRSASPGPGGSARS